MSGSLLSMRQRELLGSAVTYALLAVTTGLLLAPVAWAVLNSLRPPQMLFEWPPTILSSAISLDNYQLLMAETKFPTFVKNSVYTAVMTVTLTLLITVPAAYSVSRYDFRGRSIIANFSTLVYMFPLILLGIPFFVIFTRLGLYNTLHGLSIAQTARAIPFALLLLSVFFGDIPSEIEESARIMGASRFTILTRLILPLSLPGLIATTIFVAVLSWIDYFFALIMLGDEVLYTLPRGLASFINMDTNQWGMVLAGVVVMSIPPLLLIFFLYRHLVEGFAMDL